MSRATTTVDLGPELRGFIESLVESGDYQTQSEAIREAVRMLKEQQAASKLETLRQLVRVGEASGDAMPWEAERFLERMKGKHGRP